MVRANDPQLVSRIATLETQTVQFQRSLDAVSASVTSMEHKLDATYASVISNINEVQTKIDAKLDRLNSERKTEWGTIAAWAGVFLLIAGLVVSSYNTDKESIDKNIAAIATHDQKQTDVIVNLLMDMERVNTTLSLTRREK